MAVQPDAEQAVSDGDVPFAYSDQAEGASLRHDDLEEAEHAVVTRVERRQPVDVVRFERCCQHRVPYALSSEGVVPPRNAVRREIVEVPQRSTEVPDRAEPAAPVHWRRAVEPSHAPSAGLGDPRSAPAARCASAIGEATTAVIGEATTTVIGEATTTVIGEATTAAERRAERRAFWVLLRPWWPSWDMADRARPVTAHQGSSVRRALAVLQPAIVIRWRLESVEA